MVLSDQGASSGYKHINLVSQGGVFSVGTSTDIFATSTTQAMSLNMNTGTTPSLGISTSSPFAIISAVRTVSATAPLMAIASSTATGAGMPVFMLDQYGRPYYSGPKPTCDANCTFVAGNDARFRIKLGSAVTTSTVTFANGSWGLAPICVANEGDAGTVDVSASSTPTTVVLTALSSLSSKDVDIHCDGIQ